MDKILRIAFALFAVVAVVTGGFLLLGADRDAGTGSSTATIYFFYGQECVHCHNVMPFVLNMTQKYPEADIRILEVWHNQTNQKLYQRANAIAGVGMPGVPQVVYGKVVLSGELQIPDRMEALIQDQLKKKA